MKHLQRLKIVERMPNLIVEDVRDICVCLYIPISIKAFMHIVHVHMILGFSPFY